MVPSSHATTRTPIVPTGSIDTVERDEHLARVSVECLQRHPGRREQVLANRYQAPRREGEQATREPGKDPLPPVVQRFVGHLLLELAAHRIDVDAKLIRPVRAHVGGEIADRDASDRRSGTSTCRCCSSSQSSSCSCSAIARGSLPNAAKTKSCSGMTASTATPPGDDPEMQSTVVLPKGMSTHPSPMGGTLGTPMSCDTDCMRAVDSGDSTRVADGETPSASWVRPNARRSPIVPIGD